MHTLLNRILIVGTIAGGIVGNANAAVCTALLGHQNDLWLIQPNKTVPIRMSNDGALKTAAALHPSSTVTVYSEYGTEPELVVVDQGGRLLERLKLSFSSPVIALKWISETVLRVSEHQGPTYSKHHFFTLDTSNRLSRITTGDSTGNECAISSKQGELACFSADAVTVDGRDIYFLSEGLETAAPLQTVNVALGTSAQIDVSPAMRVEFKAQTGTAVTLRAMTATGQWRERRIRTGQSMLMPAGDDESTVSLEPVRTADPNTIKLVVKKISAPPPSFEGTIAWDSKGKRIAFAEAAGINQRTGLLLHRQAGQAAIVGKGGVDAQFKLPIQGPIVSVRFLSDSVLRFEGLNQAVEYTIPPQGKVSPQSSYSIKPVIPAPTTLEAEFPNGKATAVVRAWQCT